MKRLLYRLCLSALTLGAVSCNAYLDIKPKGALIPETTADYETMLNYVQITKGGDPYPLYMTDDVYLPDQSLGFGGSFATSSPSVQNLYTFQQEVFGESEDDALWNNAYQRMYYFNVLIDKVMGATGSDDATKRALRAEALLGRAYEYLMLVNVYAKHYDSATATRDLGVPLILDDAIERSGLVRATVAEVYARVESDLIEALRDLPEKPRANAFRASRAAGYALLSRMYLYKGDYDKALANAKLALDTNSTLIDLSQYRVLNPMGAIGRIDVPERDQNPENIYLRVAGYAYGMSAQVFVSDDLLALYDQDKDMRYQLYMVNNFGPLSFPRPLWMPFITSNIGMATPELYLIAAECEARQGNTAAALTYLNALRSKRIQDAVALSATSSEEALDLVLAERRRELALTGNFRLIDLKRLSKEPRYAKLVVHSVAGEDYRLESGSARYVLPIPTRVMNFNTGTMVQNAR